MTKLSEMHGKPAKKAQPTKTKFESESDDDDDSSEEEEVQTPVAVKNQKASLNNSQKKKEDDSEEDDDDSEEDDDEESSETNDISSSFVVDKKATPVKFTETKSKPSKQETPQQENTQAGQKRKREDSNNSAAAKKDAPDSDVLAKFKNQAVEVGDVKIEIRQAMERRLRRQNLCGLFIEGHIAGSNKENIQKLVSTKINGLKWRNMMDTAVLYFDTKEASDKAASKLRSNKVRNSKLTVKDEAPGTPGEMVCVTSEFNRVRISDVKNIFHSAEELTTSRMYYGNRIIATYKKKALAKVAVDEALNTRVRGQLLLPKFVTTKDEQSEEVKPPAAKIAALDDGSSDEEEQMEEDESSSEQEGVPKAEESEESEDDDDEDDTDSS